MKIVLIVMTFVLVQPTVKADSQYVQPCGHPVDCLTASDGIYAEGGKGCFRRLVNPFASEGTQCQTLEGIVFVRIRDPFGSLGWQDTGENGKVWYYDDTKSEINEKEAKNFCKAKNHQKLPVNRDYFIAEDHGFREVMDFSDYTWSSSFYFWGWIGLDRTPGSGDGYVFSIGNVIHMDRNSKATALCVGR